MTEVSLEQLEWVFKRLCEHLKEGGSFRHLIYNRLKQSYPQAYSVLYNAGGEDISNALNEYSKKYKE